MILVHDDNLVALAGLGSSHCECVTLAYLDPPFFSGRAYRMSDGALAFDDRWTSRDEYLTALSVRIALVRQLLAPHGSMVVHVDTKTSHYVKVLCDGIFGDDAFASEIVWRYRRWPSKTPNFQRVHDVLLRYRKDPSVAPRWNQLHEPLAASTVETWGTGRQVAVVGESGRRLRSSTTEEQSKGVPMGDVWDIGVIAPVSKERTGFPTQKPIALLRRLIEALTNPGEIVLDPFVGSGTTLVAAAELGREAIGIDASDVAIDVTRARLEARGVAVQLLRRAA
jgi:DNA modification methylase